MSQVEGSVTKEEEAGQEPNRKADTGVAAVAGTVQGWGGGWSHSGGHHVCRCAQVQDLGSHHDGLQQQQPRSTRKLTAQLLGMQATLAHHHLHPAAQPAWLISALPVKGYPHPAPRHTHPPVRSAGQRGPPLPCARAPPG